MTPSQKALKVARNQRQVLDYIYYLLEHRGHGLRLTEGILYELHRLTIGDMYPCSGNYRDAHYEVTLDGTRVPEAYVIRFRIQDIICQFNDNYDDDDILTRISKLHFRFTALHPFNGGNGRIARALMTLFLLPDVEQTVVFDLISWIKQRREQYILSLKLGEASFGRFIWYGVMSIVLRRTKNRSGQRAIRTTMRTVKKAMPKELARML